RRPLDLDEIVHAGISLEADGGAIELVLPDLAIDGHRDVEAEALEDLDQRSRLVDTAVDLLALLVAVDVRRRSFPIDLGAHAGVVAVRARAQHVVTPRELARAGVETAILENALKGQPGAARFDERSACLEVTDHALQLELDHRRGERRIASITASVSERSWNTATAP